MTTPAQHPSISAVRRAANAFCEMIDALEQLREADYGLYLVSLEYCLRSLRQRTQRELYEHHATQRTEPQQ